ncbi:DUF4160 domain-containing protein [Chitinibacter sp. S2-10]|uniref:DUF4160 domain-containing protein n=1 Tax=Chitinibacter sp. S2-10 TaxID=3373597 RepID=UPI0039778024
MPTLLLENGFKFFFYANEHMPRHVHVMKGEYFAKVELGSLRLVNSTFKPADQRAMLALVALHNDAFTEKWDAYFATR